MFGKSKSQYFERTIDWEDAQAVRTVCESIKGHMVAVAGAGDVSLSFLSQGCASVTVICDNRAERALLELKLMAIRSLHIDNVYNLFGIHPGGRRVYVYHQLRSVLSDEVAIWWDEREDCIREGILYSGAMERKHQQVHALIQRLQLDVKNEDLRTLTKRKRWRLVQSKFEKAVHNSISPSFWKPENPYAQLLLHSTWSPQLFQLGFETLSSEGIGTIQCSQTPLYVVTGALDAWLQSEHKEQYDGIYLGPLSGGLSPSFWRAISNALSITGKVVCWSIHQPQTETMNWTQYTGPIRSVHSGTLWIGQPRT